MPCVAAVSSYAAPIRRAGVGASTLVWFGSRGGRDAGAPAVACSTAGTREGASLDSCTDTASSWATTDALAPTVDTSGGAQGTDVCVMQHAQPTTHTHAHIHTHHTNTHTTHTQHTHNTHTTHTQHTHTHTHTHTYKPYMHCLRAHTVIRLIIAGARLRVRDVRVSLRAGTKAPQDLVQPVLRLQGAIHFVERDATRHGCHRASTTRCVAFSSIGASGRLGEPV